MVKEEITCLTVCFKQSDGRYKVCFYDKKNANELFDKLVELTSGGRGFGIESCQIMIEKTEEGGA